MAYYSYRVPEFLGIHQGVSENVLSAAESPNACNMDTAGGSLSVCRGMVQASDAALEPPSAARRLAVVTLGGDTGFLAATATTLDYLGPGETAWRTLHTFDTAHDSPAEFDFQQLMIGSTEYLLVAHSRGQVLKWDGASATASPFGTAEALSDASVRLLEVYYGRLFAAGDGAHPGRLYWSAAPGDGRTVEDWSSVASSENVSGGHVEVGADSDPITGLFALSNQLVIFKRDSVYRLLGDRPSNYRIYPVNAAMEQAQHTACVRHGDVLYALTAAGLYCYDGQTMRRMSDADKIRRVLANCDLARCSAAACRDRLYFAVREGTGAVNDAIIEYDLTRRTYMLRRGFTAAGLAAANGTLYVLSGDGHVCRFNEGTTYAGNEIAAYWTTPETDLGSKATVKHLKELYLRGSGGILQVGARSAGGTVFFSRLMPLNSRDVLEAPLSGSGRAFSLKIGNEGGSRFTVEGGLELLIDAQRRVL